MFWLVIVAAVLGIMPVMAYGLFLGFLLLVAKMPHEVRADLLGMVAKFPAPWAVKAISGGSLARAAIEAFKRPVRTSPDDSKPSATDKSGGRSPSEE